MSSKKPNLFWDTISQAKIMVQQNKIGSKRATHKQKKMPFKMLKGVRRKMQKRIRTEREGNIESGIIYNSFHRKDRDHFAIQNISNADKRAKLLRNDFGKTATVLKTEQTILEKKLQRKEKRKLIRKEKKHQLKRNPGRVGEKESSKKIEVVRVRKPKKKPKQKLGFKDGILTVNPDMFN